MGSRMLVIRKITLQDAAQRSLISHDEVVQAFATNGADEALHIRILPGAAWRRNHIFHSQGSGEVGEISAIDGVAIAQQIGRRLVPRERLPNLLHRPLLGRLFRHLEMQYVASGCQRSSLQSVFLTLSKSWRRDTQP